MKVCVIHQPGGLGDILWLQPIVDNILQLGYTIYFPVVDIYHEMLQNQLVKTNLIWVNENSNFPLKEYYGTPHTHQDENNLYIPISFANYMYAGCSNMMAKYYFTNTPIVNWHPSVTIKRNKDKENIIFEVYKINPDIPFVLLNRSYGTPPSHKTRKIELQTSFQVLDLSIETNLKYKISLFDCLGVIENAAEIHTVETSVCHLADKYAKTNKLFMYEKRLDNEAKTYYAGDNRVYRNPHWTYNCF